MILGILSKTLALNNVQSYCIQLIVFAIQQLRHMPDGLKNLGASSFRHFGKGERLRGTRASEKCIVTKKRATNLQNRDALCSQPCTFAMGPESGWSGDDFVKILSQVLLFLLLLIIRMMICIFTL